MSNFGINEFWHDISLILFGNFTFWDIFKMGVSCYIMSLLFLFLDCMVKIIFGYSYIVKPGKWNSRTFLIVLFGWPISSMLVGMLAYSLKALNANLPSVIFVCISWPNIYKRIVEGARTLRGDVLQDITAEA